jgi:shikimate kinase / 3-dehydroquinate synthase
LDSPLDRHVALIGFMGAGKSTLGREVAKRLGREFVDLDREIERQSGERVPQLFARGETAFRVLETGAARSALRRTEPTVIALGGGSIEDEATRTRLRERAVTVLLDVDVDEAWRRTRGGDRPLARDEQDFRALYARRDPLYRAAADSTARDADDVVLAAGGVHVRVGALEQLAALVPGEAPVALVADARVAGIHGAEAQLALGGRVASMHELPAGEAAKSPSVCERLWRELRLDRDAALVALGGGSTTDAAGFVAATYLRGVPWVTVPTTLLGQVDAAIGGKTALNLPGGKNLVGAFHWPARTVIDPGLLSTLPARELHAGLAEVVKTGLLAGESLWELPRPEQVRRCAAFKTAVCLQDPYERGPRTALNLGHTFAHALETASDYRVPHGEAVSLGLLAALRLCGLEDDVVQEQLRPKPVRVDRDRAWAALQRDKKRAAGELRLVLLDAPGKPRLDAAVPEDEVRNALDALIAG